MPGAREQQQATERLKSRAVRYGTIAVLLLLALYATFGANGLVAQYEKWRRHGELEAELARERAINAAIEHDIEALRSDDLAIERAARVELDYKRPGEVVFIVGNDDPLAGADAESFPGGAEDGPARRFDSPGGSP